MDSRPREEALPMTLNASSSVSPFHLQTVVSTTTTTTAAPEIISKTSLGLGGFLILALFVIVVTIVVKRRFEKDRNESEEMDTVNSDIDSDDTEEMQSKLFGNRNSCFDVSKCITDKDLLETILAVTISVNRLSLSRQLGKGQFGAVYEARLAEEETDCEHDDNMSYRRVAVKTLKGAAMDRGEIEAFLKEGILMRDFSHKHVLELVGVAFGDHGVPMIILPFMANGCLRDYIIQEDRDISIRALLQFGYMIAQGMQYLANQKFVHRDLATRNCMVDDELCAKVADFGLSRDIYDTSYYASHDRDAKLPVKWMALESLISGVYTTKTDVWSFGVLLWELMTRGVTPYPDVANWDMRNYINSGRRMHKPDLCPDEVYDVMLQCWNGDPKQRPPFCALVQELNEILHYEDDDPRASVHDVVISIEPTLPTMSL